MELKATSKNVIPAKAGIQKLLTSLDSRLRGSNKLIVIRGSLKLIWRIVIPAPYQVRGKLQRESRLSKI
jgi:hypothetical protein